MLAASWHQPAAGPEGRQAEEEVEDIPHRLFPPIGYFPPSAISPIGYFHVDIAEVHTKEGKLYLFVAIDRTSKFAFAERHERAPRKTAADFLRRLIEIVPYKIHTVLTDNGTQFTTPGNRWSAAKEIREALDRGEIFRAHAFELACAQNHIDHRLTKPNHPWTNGQVERMNRTLKEATVRKYHYQTHQELRDHLQTYLMAYTPEISRRPDPS